ncbi:MAG: hypothetical protein V7L23_25440, partial [Nostoc sp.]|uniref:hypothetical protein n=1 Tax=Nostoc sp. TaxID=1180 RepID=UPI002FF08EEB
SEVKKFLAGGGIVIFNRLCIYIMQLKCRLAYNYLKAAFGDYIKFLLIKNIYLKLHKITQKLINKNTVTSLGVGNFRTRIDKKYRSKSVRFEGNC